MGGVRILPLAPETLKDYKRIRFAALKDAPTAFSGDPDEEAALDDRQHALPLQIGTVYGAYDGGQVIGMTGVILHAKKKMRHKASLWGVYVAPTHRGRGIARAMLERALGDLPARITHVTLGVEINNAPALALYRALGFEECGRDIGAFMQDGVLHDEIMMVKIG